MDSIDKLTCMTDLHLHLDGAISVESAKKLAAAQGISIPQSDEELTNLLRVSPDCKDLNEFLEKFAFPNTLLQTKEGLKMSVSNLLEELNSQGVMYTEIRFAPQLSTEKGLTQEQAIEACIEGTKGSPVKCNIIACCMRGTDTHEKNMATVNAAAKYLGKGLCAIDLAGAEALYPTKDYQAEYDLAKQLNIPITVHAGEADGPDSVKAALSFGTHRIGHGVNSIKDSDLMKRLANEQIVLEMCPTSNVQTQICKSIEEHPIKQFVDAGCYVTINTDDPSVEGTDIKTEYKKVFKAFGFTKDDCAKFLHNSVNAAFTDDDTKAELNKKIDEQFANFK